MHFSELYEYANGLEGPWISVEQLKLRIIAHHYEVEAINFYPVDIDPEIMLGHMLYERERTSAYEGEFAYVNVRYWQGLNQSPWWMRRWVCCKEMMHVFDTDDEKTSDRQRLLTLFAELEAGRMVQDMSPMMASENDAQWMALAVLCPATIRARYRPDWLAKNITDYDVALACRIPEYLISSLMSDYYDSALARLLKEKCG